VNIAIVGAPNGHRDIVIGGVGVLMEASTANGPIGVLLGEMAMKGGEHKPPWERFYFGGLLMGRLFS